MIVQMRTAGLGSDRSIGAWCRRAVLCAVVGGAAVISPSIAAAEIIPVSTKSDSGPGSLRDAIEEANDELSTPGADTIKIKPTGTINLASALPELTTDMTIVGPGAKALTVARAPAAPDFRVFLIPQGANIVSIKRIAIKNGSLNGPGAVGGGIRNSATLTLSSVLVSGNSVADPSAFAFGAGISNSGDGDLTIRDSRITHNEIEADGGGSGIRSEGDLMLIRSTVDRNVNSAAIQVGSGGATATIQNSTIANNEGVGLLGAAVSLVVTSSTIAGNDGIEFAPVNVQLLSSPTSAQFGNTIVAKPPDFGTNCMVSGGAVLTSNGFNLSSDDSCPFDQASDQTEEDPRLRALEDNGGPTPTMAIPKSSPATDKGGSGGLTTDQRRKRRPVNLAGIGDAAGGDGADVGAFEIQKP